MRDAPKAEPSLSTRLAFPAAEEAWKRAMGQERMTVRQRAALVAALEAAPFSPVGDNHHNAAACPYCSAG